MSKARDLADGTFDTDTLVVDAANNRVGIGTASPATNLHLSTTGDTAIQITKQGSVGARVKTVAGALSFGVDGSNGDTERMRIDSSGNVGIGTTSPDLVGSTTNLTIDSSGGNGQLSLKGNGTVYGRIFADNATGDLKMGNPTSNDVMLYTANLERMRITSGGSVLIGTTTGTGDTANTAAVIGGFFTSKYGITSIPSTNTWTTVHTFANNAGNFMVSMRASGTGNTTHNSVGVAVIQASGATAFDYIRNGGNVQIRMSGLNLQVYQSVFAGANINWGVTNLGP